MKLEKCWGQEEYTRNWSGMAPEAVRKSLLKVCKCGKNSRDLKIILYFSHTQEMLENWYEKLQRNCYRTKTSRLWSRVLRNNQNNKQDLNMTILSSHSILYSIIYLDRSEETRSRYAVYTILRGWSLRVSGRQHDLCYW